MVTNLHKALDKEDKKLYNQDNKILAVLLAFEMSKTWAILGHILPVKPYHTHGSKTKKERLVFLFSQVINCNPKDKQFLAFSLISLGLACLFEANPNSKDNKISQVLDNLATDIGGIGKFRGKIPAWFETAANVFTNAFIMAGAFGFQCAPEKALMHEWSIDLPLTKLIDKYNKKAMYPYMVLCKLVHHYHTMLGGEYYKGKECLE